MYYSSSTHFSISLLIMIANRIINVKMDHSLFLLFSDTDSVLSYIKVFSPNEHDAWQPEPDPAGVRDRSHASIIQVALTGIVTLAVLVFVVLWLWLGKVEWVVFPCFVPAAVITYLVLNTVFFHGRGNLYVVLGLVASIFLVGYLVLLRFGMNFWQLFLILIPAEAVVYFSFNIRAKH